MTTITMADGCITRQLLPRDAKIAFPNKVASIRQAYRWVTWCEDAIEPELAQAHLRSSGSACIVYGVRGPKGGWSDFKFVRAGEALPKLKLGLTLHFGWVQERVAPNYNFPRDLTTDELRQMAHMKIHA